MIPSTYLGLSLLDVLMLHGPPRERGSAVAVSTLSTAIEQLAAKLQAEDACDRTNLDWLAAELDRLGSTEPTA